MFRQNLDCKFIIFNIYILLIIFFCATILKKACTHGFPPFHFLHRYSSLNQKEFFKLIG